MSSPISLSPIEDCQLYQKRFLLKTVNGEVKRVHINIHKKETKKNKEIKKNKETKKNKNRNYNFCGSMSQ